MEFQLDNAAVKGMVKVLRTEFPELKHARGYEVVSKMFKQPNWDTLSGMLKTNEQQISRQEAQWNARHGWCLSAPALSEPVKLYVRAYAEATGAEAPVAAPSYAFVTLNTELLELIHNTQTRVLSSGVEESTVNAPAVEWDPRYGGTNLRPAQIIVSEDSVRFSAYLWNANYAVETIEIRLGDLYEVLTPNGSGNTTLDWADGVLFADDGDGAKEFARELFYAEVVDINEVGIDKMVG